MRITIWQLLVLTFLAALQVRSTARLVFGIAASVTLLVICPLLLFLVTLFRPAAGTSVQDDPLVKFILSLLAWSVVNLVVVLAIVYLLN